MSTKHLMRIMCLLVTSLSIFSSDSLYGQCTGCTRTINANASITTTAANQVICITGGTSYTLTAEHTDVKVKVCTPNVVFTNITLKPGGTNLTVEARAANTQISALSTNTTATVPSISGFSFISYSSGAKFNPTSVSTSTPNFTLSAKSGGVLDVVNNITTDAAVTLKADTSGTLNIKQITFNGSGSRVIVNRGAVLNVVGTFTMQNNASVYNENIINVTGQMTVQGGTNALYNKCGESTINVLGNNELIINQGQITNGGTIKAPNLRINSNAGPLFPKRGSLFEATGTMTNMDQDDFIRGDSMPTTGTWCSTFKIPAFNTWNRRLSSTNKVYYCGPAANAAQRGSAVANCSCSSKRTFCDPALPVKILSFDATPSQSGINISWSAIAEKDNSHYELLRSTDGKEYSLLRKVDGRLSSSEVNYYEYTDEDVVSGTYYYKLIQYDLNGSSVELGKKSVTVEERHLKIAPNPVSDGEVVIQTFGNEKATLRVFSSQGIEMMMMENARPFFSFSPLSEKLPQGMYLVIVETNTGYYSGRFIVK